MEHEHIEIDWVNYDWRNEGRLLRWEPTHEGGVGRYYKKPGSGQDSIGYFGMARALYNHRFYEEDIENVDSSLRLKSRCDASAPKQVPMPTGLHDEDEETGLCKFCGSDMPIYGTTNSHYASLSTSKILRIPFHGYKGFIVYIELLDPEIEELDVYTNRTTTRTLQEMFKLLLEWDWVYSNIDNTDMCAILAHEMLEELDMPEDIRQWVIDNVPDMDVARYFRGDPDARSRPDPSTIPDMSEEFEKWCWYNIVIKPRTWPYGGK